MSHAVLLSLSAHDLFKDLKQFYQKSISLPISNAYFIPDFLKFCEDCEGKSELPYNIVTISNHCMI